MLNNVLFGIIGLLMAAIAGVGVVSAAAHPEKVAEAGTEVVQTTERVVAQVQEGAQKLIPAHKGGDENGQENENESEDDGDDDDSRSTASKNTAVNPAASAPAPSTSAPSTAGSAQSGAKTFTMAQVASHNSAVSCYTAIGGSVYDLTSFINQHPGGSAAIKSLCGIDGTAAFNAQHGGQSRPANELASLKIGVVAQ
jgi:cytochrome b involved in lipid metabolism